jgi:hypothetical protein
VVGTLALGSRHYLSYAPDEMEFLITTAHQVGLAVENMRLVEQILRSHRQWTNTFDSIHDLLHDSEFRVMKANHALLERLSKAPADVVGLLCEAVLSRDQAQWKGWPYCRQRGGRFPRRSRCRLPRFFHGVHIVVCGAGKQAEGHHPARDGKITSPVLFGFHSHSALHCGGGFYRYMALGNPHFAGGRRCSHSIVIPAYNEGARVDIRLAKVAYATKKG